MKGPQFGYAAPGSLSEALSLRARHGTDATVLAGGQSLIPLLKLRGASPATILDLGRVSELVGIRELDTRIAIGAMTRQRVVERSAAIAQRCPLLVQALRQVGHVAIRNRGTFGGSIAHADRAAELPGAVVALGADVLVRSVRGERRISAAEFFIGHRATVLEADELLVEVALPDQAPGYGFSFVEVARREFHTALAGAFTVIGRQDGRIAEARVVLIAGADGAVRAPAAETVLVGSRSDAALFEAAAEAAAAEFVPISDRHGSSDYRRRLVTVAVRRALIDASRRSRPDRD